MVRTLRHCFQHSSRRNTTVRQRRSYSCLGTYSRQLKRRQKYSKVDRSPGCLKTTGFEKKVKMPSSAYVKTRMYTYNVYLLVIEDKVYGFPDVPRQLSRGRKNEFLCHNSSLIQSRPLYIICYSHST